MISGVEMRQNIVFEVAIDKIAPRACQGEGECDRAGHQRGRSKKCRGATRQMRPRLAKSFSSYQDERNGCTDRRGARNRRKRSMPAPVNCDLVFFNQRAESALSEAGKFTRAHAENLVACRPATLLASAIWSRESEPKYVWA